MGCDIHMWAERKVKSTYEIHEGDNIRIETNIYWSKLGDVFTNEYFDPERPLDNKWNSPVTDQPYHDRNYTLFSFLADVRNYHDLKPISLPRGLPEDVSTEIQEEMNEFGGHSASWLTLKEIEEANWNQIIESTSLLKKDEVGLFEQTGRPPIFNDSRWSSDKDKYIEVKYKTYVYEQCSDFLESMKKIERLKDCADQSPEDIRIVFFFDN